MSPNPPCESFGAPGPDGLYWCGPSAVAHLIGSSYVHALAAVRHATGRPVLDWMRWTELLGSLRAVGRYAGKISPLEGRLGPRRGLRGFAAEHRAGDYVVRVGGHFLVLRDGLLYDNHRAAWPTDSVRWMVTHALPIKRSNA